MDTGENEVHLDDFDAGAQLKRLLRAVRESRFRLTLFAAFGV